MSFGGVSLSWVMYLGITLGMSLWMSLDIVNGDVVGGIYGIYGLSLEDVVWCVFKGGFWGCFGDVFRSFRNVLGMSCGRFLCG